MFFLERRTHRARVAATLDLVVARSQYRSTTKPKMAAARDAYPVSFPREKMAQPPASMLKQTKNNKRFSLQSRTKLQ